MPVIQLSFRSIAKHMPSLISIHCNIGSLHNNNIFIPEIVLDEDIFHYIRFLHLPLTCHYNGCVCGNLVSRLLDRTPKLECLNTTNDGFLFEQLQFPSIKQFIYRKYKPISINMIIKCLPNLTTLSVEHFGISVNKISTFISSFFLALPSFKSISSHHGTRCIKGKTSYEKYMQEALALIQNMNHSLRHIIVDFKC
ncbi:hypothetical protein I4U23_015952 [Adineta vaga]|nr:hypothetical protein I4U23_015952 [Adineta vaga]